MSPGRDWPTIPRWLVVGHDRPGGAWRQSRGADQRPGVCAERAAAGDHDPIGTGAELSRLLDERRPVLLVVDDVWEECQLRPFRIGGKWCTRLVTTRVPGLLPYSRVRIPVDLMSAEQ